MLAAQVESMFDQLPNKELNTMLVRMSVWVTDDDASDYLAVFASADERRAELLGMAPSKGAGTKYGVVMFGTSTHAMH